MTVAGATSLRAKRIQNFQRTLIFLLGLILFASALALVLSLHFSRLYFAQLQLVEKERDELYIEWTKLLLEQGVTASEKTIDNTAEQRLHMHIPEMKEIIMVKP